MKQDERWQRQYELLMEFMTTRRRRPSKHRIEEHLMLNWVKYNKKRMAKGELTPDRQKKFLQLMALAEKYRRLNQYEYLSFED